MGLVSLGASSVVYWAVYDDLRFYALVQFFTLALVPLMFGLFSTKYTGAVVESYLYVATASQVVPVTACTYSRSN